MLQTLSQCSHICFDENFFGKASSHCKRKILVFLIVRLCKRKEKAVEKRAKRLMEPFKNNSIWRYSYVFWVLLYQSGKDHDRLIYQVFNLGELLVHENINPLLHTFIFILSVCRYGQT